MGQKVHPTGYRLGIVKDHTSVWYANRSAYAKNLLQDLEVRKYLEGEAEAGFCQSHRDRASCTECTHHYPHCPSRHCDW